MVMQQNAIQKRWFSKSFPCFFLNDGKEHFFYGHYIIFPSIFFHLFGTLQGNTLGHNSVLEENSNDEPGLFKDSLTLICHMQSLCVRLKIVFQFCEPVHKTLSYNSSKSLERDASPDNKCSIRNMDKFQGIQLLSFSDHGVSLSSKNHCAHPWISVNQNYISGKRK